MTSHLPGIVEAQEVILLATGYGATEGPLWHREGYVTFVDIPGGLLLQYGPDAGVKVIRENTEEGNGCTLDPQNRLIMCHGGDHPRISRTEADGSIATIAQHWQGKRLNKPNDVICRSDGTVYFTDPELRVPLEQRELGFAGVFYISPDGTLNLGTTECEYPNGLALSPDESTLYVAITRLDDRCTDETERGDVCPHRKLRAFRVSADGSLSNNRVFADMSSSGVGAPDGVKVDVEGRVYCTCSGSISVFDPAGGKIGEIGGLPEGVRNIAFGGPDHQTLYITGGTSLYSLQTSVTGIAPS